jgi:ribokinase
VETVWRPEPQRRAFVHVDAAAERTITVIGPRMGPHGDDPLPWDELAEADAVYITAGDLEAIRGARAARNLVATTRANEILVPAHVQLDVLVRSARDPGEQYVGLDPPPRFVAETDGALGGSLVGHDGSRTHWDPAPLPAPAVDAYGAGDSFAAGLTYGLARGLEPIEAVRLGARCGAVVMTGRGPYESGLPELGE